MSDMLGTGYQKPTEPTVVRQAVQVWQEGPERSPYAHTFLPGFVDAEQIGAGAGAGLGSGAVAGAGAGMTTPVKVSLDPQRIDLAYTSGDWAVFGFFFERIAWVEEQPSEDGWSDIGGIWTYTDTDTAPDPAVTTLIPWVPRKWSSEVRTRHYQRFGYWWPPVRPFGYLMTEFEVTATWVPRSDAQVPGTMVTIEGVTLYPGRFAWDLQAVGLDEQDPPQFTRPITLLKGEANVGNQVTL